MDLSKLRQGERVAGVAGIALFVFMFFGWYGAKVSTAGISQSVPASANAWEAFSIIDIVLFLTAAAAVGLAVLTATQRRVNLPVAASAITAALGILSVVLVIYRIIDTPGESGSFYGANVEITRKIGLFLGLIATAAIAAGGWLAMQEEGTSFGDARDQLSGAVSGGGSGDSPTPPPPPPAPPADAPTEMAGEPPAPEPPGSA